MSRFEIVRALGDGGMGQVYLARDDDREVALKRMIDRYLGRPEREQRLVDEAAYLEHLRDVPGVVSYLDSGRDEAGPWLTMEVMRGHTLAVAPIVEPTWDAARAVSIAHALAQTLVEVHEAGIVHRDVTPANVFVCEDGSIRLFDFGHATWLEPRGDERLTQVFEVPGTAGFMSPEQVSHFPAAPAMDVYAFGSLLYELLTLRPAFEGLADRPRFIEAQRGGLAPPKRIHGYAYGVDDATPELVDACLQRDPEARPTMPEVVAVLGKQLESFAAVSTSEDEPPIAAPVEATPDARPRRRRLAVPIALSLAVVAAIVAVRLVDVEGRSDAATSSEDPEPAIVADAPRDPTPPDLLREPPGETVQDVPDLPAAPPPDLPAEPAHDPHEPSKPKLDPSSPECVEPRAQATAALDDWKWQRVLDVTEPRACWTVQERIALRTQAYAELGNWRACVAAGKRGRSKTVQDFVEHCQGNL